MNVVKNQRFLYVFISKLDMQQLIELIEDFIKTKFGDDSLKVFKVIGVKENVSEFKIAEDLKKNINYVRSLLYKLYSHHLVYTTRKKDRQKGWYIYYWTFNFKHARDLLILNKNKRLERLKSILNKERYEEIYVCPNSCTRFKLEDAMEQNFKCPECESILKKEENINEEEVIKEEIERLEKDIELLKKPVEIRLIKEEERVAKKKPRKIKKIMRKKAKGRVKRKVTKKIPKIKKVLRKKRKIKKIKKITEKQRLTKPLEKNRFKEKSKKGFFGRLKKRIRF